MKILKQIVKEFWVQTIISILWALYSIHSISSDQNLILSAIKNFGACFFLTSWFAGQLLRIIKQQKLEGNLENILSRMEGISNNIQTFFKDLKGYSIGGDSFCYLDVTRFGDEYVIGLRHKGDYPLYDIDFRLRNLNNKEHNEINNRPYIRVGDLGVGLVKIVDDIKIEDNSDNYIKYEISYLCRKGHFEQELRLIKFENTWYTALRILENNNEIFRQLHENYPIKEPFK